METATLLEQESVFCTLSPGKVDRENRVIFGVVLAEVGPFKDGRGEFDSESLDELLELMQTQEGRDTENGLRSRWTHPSIVSDAAGSFIGRFKNPRIEGEKLKADLHIDPTAMMPPPGKGGTAYGEYLMTLAESDPGAIQTSLVLQREVVKRNKKQIWKPVALRACDFVDTGNAVHGDFLQDKSTDEVDAETNREKVESRLEQKETLDRRFREKVMQDDQISRGDVENIISEKLDSFLSALADKEKAEQEKQEQATQEALVANSTAAVDFVLRATSISFPADKASEIAGKIQKGELSLDAATQHLLQHKAEELAPADVKEEVVHSEVDELLSDPEFKKVWDTIGLNKQDLEDQLQFEGHEDENPFFGNWEQNAATIESLKLGGAQ
jgi:hypothetical protein